MPDGNPVNVEPLVAPILVASRPYILYETAPLAAVHDIIADVWPIDENDGAPGAAGINIKDAALEFVDPDVLTACT